MPKLKTVIRKYENLQLRQRQRGKSLTFFLAYTLDGVRKYEVLKTTLSASFFPQPHRKPKLERYRKTPQSRENHNLQNLLSRAKKFCKTFKTVHAN